MKFKDAVGLEFYEDDSCTRFTVIKDGDKYIVRWLSDDRNDSFYPGESNISGYRLDPLSVKRRDFKIELNNILEES